MLEERRLRLSADIQNAKANEARELQRQAVEEGKRVAGYQGAAYQPGSNETERALRSMRVIGGPNSGQVQESRERVKMIDWKGGGAEKRAEEEGHMIGLIETQLRNVQMVEERRVKLAAEIVDLKRQEAKEASNALMMTDRENQLRAALIAKYMQNNGAFSAQQFQYLSQATKEAAQRYVPNALPKEYQTRTRAAQEELRMANSVDLTPFKEALKDAAKTARETSTVNEIESVKLAKELRAVSGEATGLRAEFGRLVELFRKVPLISQPGGETKVPAGATPGMTVNMGFGEQFKDLAGTLQSVVEAKFKVEIAGIRKTVTDFIEGQRIGAVQGVAGSVG